MRKAPWCLRKIKRLGQDVGSISEAMTKTRKEKEQSAKSDHRDEEDSDEDEDNAVARRVWIVGPDTTTEAPVGRRPVR